MNQLEQSIRKHCVNELNKAVFDLRAKIGKIALKPPVNGLLNKTYKHQKFVSDDFCEWVIKNAEIHAEINGGWTTNRHKNYPTTDIPVRSINMLKVPLFNLVNINILPLISKHYKLNLYFLNIMDLFVVKYDVEGQDHLETHRDGSIISFNILLNDEFEGGGTTIEHTKNIDDNFKETEEVLYQSNKGDLFIHPGKLRHSGNKITSGVRYIIVGFVEYGNVIESYKGNVNVKKQKPCLLHSTLSPQSPPSSSTLVNVTLNQEATSQEATSQEPTGQSKRKLERICIVNKSK